MGHLEWRLTHGDVPEVHQPRLAVVMIGTNDLGAASDCSGGDAEFILKAAEGVKARWDLIPTSCYILPSMTGNQSTVWLLKYGNLEL